MKQIIAALVAALVVGTGCGRPDIEEAQRSWLQDQHRLEQRLLAVRAEQNTLRRRLDDADSAAHGDAAAGDRHQRALAMLAAEEMRLNTIDTMIDRRQLARDVAIRSDDAAAVTAGYAAARADYAAAFATLDSVDRRGDEIATAIAAIASGAPADSAGKAGADPTARDSVAGAHRSTPADRPAKSSGTIENTIGRDVPEEPGK